MAGDLGGLCAPRKRSIAAAVVATNNDAVCRPDGLKLTDLLDTGASKQEGSR